MPHRIFIVNWQKLVSLLMPTFLRQPVLSIFVKSFVQAISNLHTTFLAYKSYTEYWLEIDAQVWRIEKALNDRYDTALRRIRIKDAFGVVNTPLYQKAENKQLRLYQRSESETLLYTMGETAIFVVDFVVELPIGLAYNATEMKAFVDTIKTPSKTFALKTV